MAMRILSSVVGSSRRRHSAGSRGATGMNREWFGGDYFGLCVDFLCNIVRRARSSGLVIISSLVFPFLYLARCCDVVSGCLRVVGKRSRAVGSGTRARFRSEIASNVWDNQVLSGKLKVARFA